MEIRRAKSSEIEAEAFSSGLGSANVTRAFQIVCSYPANFEIRGEREEETRSPTAVGALHRL